MSTLVSTQKRWRPWESIILLAIALVIIIGGSLTMNYIGIWGLAVIQGGLLLEALTVCLLKKTPLKQVFPVKKVKVRDFFGMLLMWMGGLMLGLVSLCAASVIFPESYDGVTSSLTNITSGAFFLVFLFTVICPPICEEAIARGAILNCLKGTKRDWITIFAVGICFGLMHTDPVRFVNTFIMGSIMAFLVIKRNNIILSVLMHFINNFVTVGISTICNAFLSSDYLKAAEAAENAEAASVFTWTATGSLAIMFCAAPILIAIGSHLIMRQKQIADGGETKIMSLGKRVLIALPFSVLMLAAGIALVVLF